MPGMITAPQPIAVEEGAKVLMAGGNAFDAAVTCAFVQMIVDPQMCGIGGYALLTAHVAGADGPVAMDAPALAGAKTSPEMWVDKVIGPNPDGWGFFLENQVNDAGYTSICTPGTVKALAAILSRWGTISWAEAIAPAARIAEDGFMVRAQLAKRWQEKRAYPEACSFLDYIERNPEASRIYLREDGSPYGMGDHLRNPDYAQTLRHLGEQGAEDFYTGELAGRMIDDLNANGAFVTADDLAGYRLRDAPAVTGTYRGYDIASSMAPHGGPTLIAILNILEGYDLAALGHNSPDYIYTVAMAMKAAFVDRNALIADPEFNDVPVDWMISKERAAYWRERIDAGDPIEPDPTPTESPHTTHVTVVDEAGNCVSLTHSLGDVVRRDHAGAGLYVQQFDDQLLPAARPPQLHRSGQEPQHGHGPDHRLSGGQAPARARLAGRQQDHHLQRAGDPQRARLRHGHRRGRPRAPLRLPGQRHPLPPAHPRICLRRSAQTSPHPASAPEPRRLRPGPRHRDRPGEWTN